jgi:hypothetical protein
MNQVLSPQRAVADFDGFDKMPLTTSKVIPEEEEE